MRRALLVAAVALLAPGSANAQTHECDGIEVCISVPGPWVAVPPAPSSRTTVVHYQLSCPRRSVAGGLDVVLSDNNTDVTFIGAIGSPVSPSVTTSRDVVFVAVRVARSVGAFRPYLGCIPTSGGGRSTTAVAPREPLVRRVKSFRVPSNDVLRGALSCRAGEHVVGSSYAVAFRVQKQPPAEWLRGVGVTLTRSGSGVLVAAQRGRVPLNVRVQVQVHLLCGRTVR